MVYFDLPFDGRSVSRFCFGCEALGGTDWGDVDIGLVTDAISLALSYGVNFFDTADIYGLGLSEKRLSAALGAKRHEVFIATKAGVRWRSRTQKQQTGESADRAETWIDNDPDYIESAIYQSLANLRLERLPVFYVHWPEAGRDLRPLFSLLHKLKLQGIVEHIGCSNFDGAQLEMATSECQISFLQIPFNILREPIEADLLTICKKHGIRINCYNVLETGLLTGKFRSDHSFPPNDRRSRMPIFKGQQFEFLLSRVAEISKTAATQGKSISEFALGEVLRDPHVGSCIVGSKSSTQFLENLAAFR